MIRTLFLTGTLALLATPVFAADCAVEIHGDDAMKFDKASIEVPATCKEFTVTLVHSGKMAKNVMGHNWVLAKTADVQSLAMAGMKAPVADSHLPKGDARVIAFTKIIGGGQSTSVTFSTSKLTKGGDYSFFCSFPGHSGLMKGKLTFG